MAESYKRLNPGTDIQQNLTKLHEAIPLTGTIVSGTYSDNNIKNYSHGMFQSVYDYPYLSSSANHIMDLTVGYSAVSTLTGSSNKTQQNQKQDVYNEIAQICAGYSSTGAIQRLDSQGAFGGAVEAQKMNEVIIVNLARLLTKDEIQKESGGGFILQLGNASSYAAPFTSLLKVYDKDSTSYKTNSPAGEFNILYASGSSMATADQPCGLLFYQAGIAAITSSVFKSDLGGTASDMDSAGSSIDDLLVSGSISGSADAFRHRFYDLDFNNTTELNSTIYFCRASNTEFNYSSNPTYLNSSKIRVKDVATDSPVSYVTSVGLYSPNNELLAVAKLSEPLKKTPADELTLRVRLDY